MPSWLSTYGTLVGLIDAVTSAAITGWLWRRKGGDVADGVALGGILGVIGLGLALALNPRRRANARE